MRPNHVAGLLIHAGCRSIRDGYVMQTSDRSLLFIQGYAEKTCCSARTASEWRCVRLRVSFALSPSTARCVNLLEDAVALKQVTARTFSRRAGPQETKLRAFELSAKGVNCWATPGGS